MTDQPPLADLPEPARPCGRIGHWSDRVKALALLMLLALAGGILGLPTGNAGDAGSPREGVSQGGSGPRAGLPDLPVTVLSGQPDDRHPDQGDGNDPPPRALAPAGLLPPMPTASVSALPTVQTVRSPTRNGHDSRMPTGPPARLSL